MTGSPVLGSVLLSSRKKQVCTPGSNTLTHPIPEGQGLPGMKRLWPRQDRKQFSTPPTLPQDSWAWAEALERDRHPLISEEKRDREVLIETRGPLGASRGLECGSQGQNVAGRWRVYLAVDQLATDSQLIVSPYNPGLDCLRKGHLHPQIRALEGRYVLKACTGTCLGSEVAA